MENKFEEKLKLGYEEYLKLPKASVGKDNVELYINNWYIRTGMSCMSPHPHRHYTFIEFVFYCGKNQSLYDRFIK